MSTLTTRQFRNLRLLNREAMDVPIARFKVMTISALLCALIVAPVAGAARAVPAAPPLERPIVDQTSTLKNEEIDRIAERINNGRKIRAYQIAVLMIPSLDGDSLEEYSLRVAREWGIGTKQDNNGALILVAKDDRRMRIEVGTGLEGDLTDARAGRIVRNVMAPEFRNNNYAKGIEGAIAAMQDALSNLPEQTNTGATSSSARVVFEAVLAPLFVILTWLAAILGRSKSWWLGGVIGGGIGLIICVVAGFALLSLLGLVGLVVAGLFFDYFVSRNYKKAAAGDTAHAAWWAGGGGFGGGRSGGGFGGGGFGGGGSSGSW